MVEPLNRLPVQSDGRPAYHGFYSNAIRNNRDFLTALNRTDLMPNRLDPAALLQPLAAHDAGVSQLTPPCGRDWAAVGDAALGFDPVSSQGIFFGMYSGIRAAEMMMDETIDHTKHYPHLAQRVFEANEQARSLFYEVVPKSMSNVPE